MPGTGGVTDKDLARGERVTIRAALRRSNDPRVIRGQHQVADLSAPHWLRRLRRARSEPIFSIITSVRARCVHLPATCVEAGSRALERWHASGRIDPLRTIAQTIAASDAKIRRSAPLNGASNCGNMRDRQPARDRSPRGKP